MNVSIRFVIASYKAPHLVSGQTYAQGLDGDASLLVSSTAEPDSASTRLDLCRRCRRRRCCCCCCCCRCYRRLRSVWYRTTMLRSLILLSLLVLVLCEAAPRKRPRYRASKDTRRYGRFDQYRYRRDAEPVAYPGSGPESEPEPEPELGLGFGMELELELEQEASEVSSAGGISAGGLCPWGLAERRSDRRQVMSRQWSPPLEHRGSRAKELCMEAIMSQVEGEEQWRLWKCGNGHAAGAVMQRVSAAQLTCPRAREVDAHHVALVSRMCTRWPRVEAGWSCVILPLAAIKHGASSSTTHFLPFDVFCCTLLFQVVVVSHPKSFWVEIQPLSTPQRL